VRLHSPVLRVALVILVCTHLSAKERVTGEEPLYEGRSVSQWIELLGDTESEPDARRAIIRIGEAAIPALIETLGAGDDQKAQFVISALRRIGKPAVGPLLEALDDEDPLVRSQVMRTLNELNLDTCPRDETQRPGARHRISPLASLYLKALEDPDLRVRVAAASGLRGAGVPSVDGVPLLEKILKDKDARVRAGAATGLRAYAADADVPVAKLEDLLSDTEPEVVQAAWETLSTTGPGQAPRSEVAVPALVTLLRHEDASIREWAARKMGGVDPRTAGSLSGLLPVLEDPEPQVRLAAAASLAHLGAGPDVVLPPAIEILMDPDQDPWLHCLALGPIEPLGPRAEAAIPALVRALPYDWSRCPGGPAHLLAEIGPAALPALLGALRRADAPMRHQIMSALNWVKDLPMHEVAALMADEQADVRAAMIRILSKRKTWAETATPQLLLAASDESPAVRAAAIRALSRADLDPAVFVPLLARIAETGTSEDRKAAARALGSLGREAGPAATALAGATKDPDPATRSAAARALGKTGRGEPVVVEALAALLRDPEADVRRDAAGALGKIGSPALSTVPALKTTLQDEDPKVAKAAREAIFALTGERVPAPARSPHE